MPEWMRLNVPEWCIDRFKGLYGDDTAAELNALNTEAPLDLRVNTLKSTREEVRQSLWGDGFDAQPTPYSPWGLRLDKRGALFNTKAFKNGWIEVQDEGSQLVALLSNAKPGEKVIDFCAGAGGKTLALAAMMQNKGRILAWDTSETRLEQSVKRLRRAGVDNVQRHALTSETDSFIKRHKDSADVVVIDAPCSGSGTWRRNPDLKWRFGERDLSEITAIQERILDSARRLVKKGGKLLYITCSLFEEENESQVKQFLIKYPEFTLASPSEIWDNDACKKLSGSSQFLRLSPHSAGTDGFFAAILHKN
jgi:16S rRNA (cytosine967-C5)-methyltransferase